jgi:ATP-dependent DNA helicase RecQ
MLFGSGDIRMRRMFIDNEDAADEHKKRSHARLATLIGYCEAALCRRQVLLGYFGEAAAPCGNCDNCLDQSPRIDGAAAARVILAVVAETGGRFGAAHIVDVLRGADTQKIRDRGHHQLSSFGTGAARKKEEWQSLIRQLAAGGFLRPDEHGGLGISEQGHALDRGDLAFTYRAEGMRSRSRSQSDGANTAEACDAALLAALKTVRLQLARERNVPAFVIFSDRTLIDMAARRPADMDSFSAVHGVGAAKLKDFGSLFVSAIAAHIGTAGRV